jgi:hypothetical protein
LRTTGHSLGGVLAAIAGGHYYYSSSGSGTVTTSNVPLVPTIAIENPGLGGGGVLTMMLANLQAIFRSLVTRTASSQANATVTVPSNNILLFPDRSPLFTSIQVGEEGNLVTRLPGDRGATVHILPHAAAAVDTQAFTAVNQQLAVCNASLAGPLGAQLDPTPVATVDTPLPAPGTPVLDTITSILAHWQSLKISHGYQHVTSVVTGALGRVQQWQESAGMARPAQSLAGNETPAPASVSLYTTAHPTGSNSQSIPPSMTPDSGRPFFNYLGIGTVTDFLAGATLQAAALVSYVFHDVVLSRAFRKGVPAVAPTA